MNFSTFEIWAVIVLLGLGTYLIRFSFLGLIGNRPLPPLMLKMLRYTPVAVLPGMVAPMVLWPPATGGEPDLARGLAALVAFGLGVATRNTIWAMVGGAVALYSVMFTLG